MTELHPTGAKVQLRAKEDRRKLVLELFDSGGVEIDQIVHVENELWVVEKILEPIGSGRVLR